MKYRLKNQDLQQRLEAFLGKEFVEEALIKGDIDNYMLTIYADLGDGSYVDVGIHIDDIEVIEEYDPDEWNNFPAVTPPENVWMRLEFDNRINGNVERHIARYVVTDGEPYWLDQDGYDVCNVDRFRPWED